LQVDFAPGVIAARVAFGAGGVFGLLMVLLWLVAVVLTVRRAPVVAFGLLWLAATLLPVANIVPTGVVLGERTLFLPSVGFLLAVGAVTNHALAGAAAHRTTSRRSLVAATTLLVVLGLLRSGGRQAVWNTAHLTIKQPTGGSINPR